MKLWKFIILLLCIACQETETADPLQTVYFAICEDTSGYGLQKSYLLDTVSLTVDLHWQNPETGKEQRLGRTDSLNRGEISRFFTDLDSLMGLPDAPWTLPLDTVLVCATCEEPQLLFRIQTKKGRVFRLQMPEDYPKSDLPEALKLQLEFLELWLKEIENKEPLLK